MPALLALACATTPSTSTTTIHSEPDGARVFIDGSYLGDTPLEVELEKRTHRVRIEKDGFEPQTSHISVQIRGDAAVSWTIAQRTIAGRHDDKYEFAESYNYVLVPVSGP